MTAHSRPEVATMPLDVVVVDDQAPFRSVARTLLTLTTGLRFVGEAETGEAGVALVEQLRPEIVLMDINLPGISGPEATRRVLAAAPATRVVLMSTYAADDLPGDALDCGAVAYLRKDDLSPAALRAALGLLD